MSERQKTKHIEVRGGLGLRLVQESEKKSRLTGVDEKNPVRWIGCVGHDECAASLAHVEARVGLGQVGIALVQ